MSLFQRSSQVSNLILGLLIVGIFAGIVFTLQGLLFDRLDVRKLFSSDTTSTLDQVADGEQIDSGLPPPFTDTVRQQLAGSSGFAALVSYTDHGFAPDNLSINVGETVRVTNNSSQDLILIPDEGSGPLPLGIGCEQADPCREIRHGEFREFRFSAPGVWHYRDAEYVLRNGAITVVVE